MWFSWSNIQIVIFQWDNLTVYRKVKVNKIRFLALSSYSFCTDASHHLRVANNSYLLRAFQVCLLLEVLEQWLDVLTPLIYVCFGFQTSPFLQFFDHLFIEHLPYLLVCFALPKFLVEFCDNFVIGESVDTPEIGLSTVMEHCEIEAETLANILAWCIFRYQLCRVHVDVVARMQDFS